VVGIDEIRRRRGRDDHLTDGPGKLCQAMGVTGEHDGLDLLSPNVIRLEQGEPVARVRSLPRVGISRAVELPWRFVADV
jgi:DNA-3-methyladenine glycosylase